VAAAAIDQGFPPDFISTDWAIQRDGSRGPNLIETMREMLGLGMGLDQIIAAVTVTPMRFYGLTPTGPAAIRLSDTLELLGIDA
jgi:predicted amidohydrolase